MSAQLKKGLWAILYVVVGLWLVACGLLPQKQSPEEPEEKTSFEEKLLATIPEDIAPEDLDYHVFSPDGTNVAYIAQQGDQQFVVVGEKRGEMFDKVAFPVFSPDGQTVAYVAQQGEKKLVVVGGDKSELFDEVWSLLFSPDSQTVAYLAQQGGKAFAVVGGERGEAFDVVESLVFSPDGTGVAYSAKTGKKWHVVVGEEKGTQYDFIGLDSIAFSPDGKTVGYLAKQGGKWFAVVGGQKGPEFDTMGAKSMVFGADGTAAYSGKRGDKWYVVVKGKESEAFDAVWPPIFSPDGKTVAFVARQGKKRSVVVGDTVEPLQFDEMWSNSPVFSPDGKTVAYFGKEGDKWYAVVDQEKGEAFDRVENVVLGPDGQTIAYFARQGGQWYIVVGDQKSEPLDGIVMTNLYIGSFKLSLKRAPTLVFSPDGQRVASVGLKGDKAYVIAGDQTSPAYDLIGGIPVCLGGQLGLKQTGSKLSFASPISVRMTTGQRTYVTGPQLVTFSLDGSKVAFGARDGRELWWKVIELD